MTAPMSIYPFRVATLLHRLLGDLRQQWFCGRYPLLVSVVDSFSFDGIHYRQASAGSQNNVYHYDSTGLAPGLYHFYLKEDNMVVGVYAGVCEQYCYVLINFISIDASCGRE